MRVLVTGGAGFIGSAVVRHFLDREDAEVLTLDKLTYAGRLASLDECHRNPRLWLPQARHHRPGRRHRGVFVASGLTQ